MAAGRPEQFRDAWATQVVYLGSLCTNYQFSEYLGGNSNSPIFGLRMADEHFDAMATVDLRRVTAAQLRRKSEAGVVTLGRISIDVEYPKGPVARRRYLHALVRTQSGGFETLEQRFDEAVPIVAAARKVVDIEAFGSSIAATIDLLQDPDFPDLAGFYRIPPAEL